MFLVLSGEGVSDLGDSAPGPIAWLLDSYISEKLGYSLLQTPGAYFFVSRSALSAIAKNLRTPLRGKRADMQGLSSETRVYYKNAVALCHWIRSKQIAGPVLALLFRDADGTASAGRGIWIDKRKAMKLGFQVEQCHGGIPVVPNPKSEAWLLCALDRSYSGCHKIELESSGNDGSPKNLKLQLNNVLLERYSSGFNCTLVNELVQNGAIDLKLLNMPSASAVREDIDEALQLLLGFSKTF